MCGMVGYFGEWSDKKEKMFCDLLRLSALRGPHSTGVAFGGVNGATDMVKDAVLPDTLMAGAEYKSITGAGWYNCYIGHNRWATTGAVVEANAHPFEFPNLIGCHNGTLQSRFDLEGGSKFDTDSETIFYNMNKDGLRETYKQLRGAVALVWWDKRNHTLNFIRNHHRPLVYAWTKDKSGIMWASEGWMIDVAAKRNKVEYGKIFDTGVHKWYEMTFHKKKIHIQKKKIKPFKPEAFIAPKRADDYFSIVQGGRCELPFGQPHNGTGTAVPANYPKGKEDSPKVGQVYSLYPRNIITSYRKKLVDSYTIVCGFQNLHKKYVAKIQIFNKTDHYLADLYPGTHSLYDKLFYKGRVSHSYHSGKQGDAKVFIINVDSIDIIVPRDCKRKVKAGVMLDRDAFDVQYKDCGFCGDPICFEDEKVEFSDKQDDLAICGKCSVSFDMKEEGF